MFIKNGKSTSLGIVAPKIELEKPPAPPVPVKATEEQKPASK